MKYIIDSAYEKFCTERFPLPSEKQVAEFEQRIGVQLPSDYRQFLLEYNGGIFNEPDLISPDPECPKNRLTFLCGIGGSPPCADLGSPDNLNLFDDNDPPLQILPIGDTMRANTIFLVTHPENNGSIGLQDIYSDNSFFLADGIERFFALLRER